MFKWKDWPVYLIGCVFVTYILVIFYCKNVTVIMRARFPHPKATLAIPSAALFALLLVMAFAKEDEFNVLGWEMKGTSGRVFLWLLIFITLTISVQVLW